MIGNLPGHAALEPRPPFAAEQVFVQVQALGEGRLSEPLGVVLSDQCLVQIEEYCAHPVIPSILCFGGHLSCYIDGCAHPQCQSACERLPDTPVSSGGIRLRRCVVHGPQQVAAKAVNRNGNRVPVSGQVGVLVVYADFGGQVDGMGERRHPPGPLIC